MINLPLLHAQPGACFVLLTDSLPNPPSTLVWQKELAADLGGMTVTPIHLTCQRFFCRDRSVLENARKRFLSIAEQSRPFVVRGERLLFIESEEEGFLTLKCRTENSPLMVGLRQKIDQTLHEVGLKGEYDGTVGLVSMLKRVPAENASLGGQKLTVPPGRPLFTARELQVSKMTAEGDFHTMWAWPLGGYEKEGDHVN